jgi:hypothetical protein
VKLDQAIFVVLAVALGVVLLVTGEGGLLELALFAALMTGFHVAVYYGRRKVGKR